MRLTHILQLIKKRASVRSAAQTGDSCCDRNSFGNKFENVEVIGFVQIRVRRPMKLSCVIFEIDVSIGTSWTLQIIHLLVFQLDSTVYY